MFGRCSGNTDQKDTWEFGGLDSSLTKKAANSKAAGSACAKADAVLDWQGVYRLASALRQSRRVSETSIVCQSLASWIPVDLSLDGFNNRRLLDDMKRMMLSVIISLPPQVWTHGCGMSWRGPKRRTHFDYEGFTCPQNDGASLYHPNWALRKPKFLKVSRAD